MAAPRFGLNRFDSRSVDAFAADVRRAAEWTGEALKTAGLQNVRLIETPGNPVVYGDWLNAPGKPTILFYGHYDVQPVDPVNLWTSPPFEATIRDVVELAHKHASGEESYLNLAICDGESLVAVRFTDGLAEDALSLYLQRVPARRSVMVCSERLSDEAGWEAVSVNHIVAVRPDRTLSVSALEL